MLTGLLLPPPLVFLLPVLALLITPFLGIIEPELCPCSIFCGAYALVAADNLAFPAISVGHALPVVLVFSALTALSRGIFADWTRIVAIARNETHQSCPPSFFILETRGESPRLALSAF